MTGIEILFVGHLTLQGRRAAAGVNLPRALTCQSRLHSTGERLPPLLVEMLYQSWEDLDHAVTGVDSDEADVRHEGLSSICWIVGHVGQQVDSWFNVRFGGAKPHPLLGDRMFHTGSGGDSAGWRTVLQATEEVRASARAWLDAVSDQDLNRTVPYTGGIEYLRPLGLQLAYAVTRSAAHTFEHVGEIMTIRSLRGHRFDESWPWGLKLLR